MTLSQSQVGQSMVGSFATLLSKFTGQVAVSIAATVCATAIYGHIVSERAAGPIQSPAPVAQLEGSRVEGGVIDTKTLAYYPEHLAALDSLSHFRPVSVQRTAELAGAFKLTQTASLADAAKQRHVSPSAASAAIDVAPVPRPVTLAQVTLAQVNVLPPRRPAAAVAPMPAPAVVAEAAPQPSPADARAKLWGMELPRFVPTGSAVMDRLASVKDRIGDKIGGLMHVSSR